MVYVIGKPLLSLAYHCKEIVDDVLLMFIGANGFFGTETPTNTKRIKRQYILKCPKVRRNRFAGSKVIEKEIK